ncbi:MAG TPA: cytochrome P450 [Ktedonobacteraceae bacterium]|nr:cytochrome P450 [Ktedonobacteraceae bacterium]
MRLPPGSLGLPLIGETPHFAKDRFSFLREHHKQYGPVFKTHLYGLPTIIFGTHEPISFLLGTGSLHFVVKNTPIVAEFFGDALFMLSGNQHLLHRKFLQPTLRGTLLEDYLPQILALCQEHTHAWCQQGPFELHQACIDLMLRIGARIIIGIEKEEDWQIFQSTFKAFLRGALQRIPFFTAYWEGQHAARTLRALLRSYIEKQAFPINNTVLSNLMHQSAREDITHEQIVDHLLALIVAGSQTTASLATWFLYEISRDKQLAATIQAEAQQILQRSHPSFREASKFPMLRSTLHEAERLHSPNILSTRETLHDCVFDQFYIPKGWQTAYSPATNHFDAAIFDAPFSFCPDRFLHQPLHFKSLTFGAGSHACVGKHFAEAQILCLASAIFSAFSVKILPNQVIKPVYLVSKVPQSGIFVTLEKLL